MAEKTDVRKLLVLHGPALEVEGVLSFLAEHFETELAQDLESALEVMRERHFDAVLAETADFLPLERGIVSQQAAAVLDTIGDGVCVVGPRGELVWANRRVRELAASVLGPLRKLCSRAYEEFASAGPTEGDRGRRFAMMPGEGEYFEVICSPIRDRAGLLRQVAAVVVNATRQRRQQIKLNAIDRAGRELVGLDDDALSRRDATQRLGVLQERIIRYAKEVLDFQHFAVLLLDERTNRLEVIISEGLAEYVDKWQLFASAEGNGICGYVAASGRSYICPDVTKDSRFLPGMENTRSSLTVPLRLHDKLIGVMNVESDRLGAFGEEDRQFAEIFANYVALALHILNLLVFERRTVHTELSGSISAELAGPFNDIITSASELMEDYIGHDDLRKRLNSIIDLVSDARVRVQQMADAGRPGLLSAAGGAVEPDPVLSGKSILIAEDEEQMRQALREVLVRYGCTVAVARDGKEAYELLGRRQYDLVISDIRMPGANGYEVFAAAKAAHSETRVILITAFGYDPHHSIVRASVEGLAAVLMKPFKAKDLLDECRAALIAPTA